MHDMQIAAFKSVKTIWQVAVKKQYFAVADRLSVLAGNSWGSVMRILHNLKRRVAGHSITPNAILDTADQSVPVKAASGDHMQVAIGLAATAALIGVTMMASQSLRPQVVPAASRTFGNQMVADTSTPAMRAKVVAAYGRTPLYFEKNQGQSDAAVQYLARGAGYSLFLTGDEAVLSLAPNASHADAPGKLASSRNLSTPATVVHTTLVGANRNTVAVGESRESGHSNYLTGQDPQRWIAGIEQFNKVRYANVYEGIDLVYYGNQRQLEYDFVVSPGADPSAIHLRYTGLMSSAVDTAGDLHLRTASGELVQKKPSIYQQKDGRQLAVAGQFKIVSQSAEKTEIAFAVADYDKSQALIIDPVLVYSTFLGGTAYEWISGVALGSDGSAYVAGYTTSANFPTTGGVVQGQYSGGNYDAFVAKLSADGSQLLYSTYVGGSSNDNAYGIAAEADGSVVVAGSTASSNFPLTSGVLQTALKGGLDGFVFKLNGDGTNLVFSTLLGGSSADVANAVTVDASGAIYLAGTTSSSDFPTTAGEVQRTLSGGSDAYVAKLRADGAQVVFSTYLGGSSSSDYAKSIAVDLDGNAYVVGYTSSANFPVSSGAVQAVLKGGQDAFVTKLRADGQGLVYSTLLGGSGADSGVGIAISSAGFAYVTGSTYSSDYPTTSNALQTSLGGYGDAFFTVLSVDGRSIAYSSYLGGSGGEQASSITLDGQQTVAYVAGNTNSSNFPGNIGAIPTSTSNAYFAKFELANNQLSYSMVLSGAGNVVQSIAANSGGSIVIAGQSSGNLQVTAGVVQSAFHGGGDDGFLASLSEATLAPALLDFGNVAVGSTSAAQALRFTNYQPTDIVINSVSVGTSVFSNTSDCAGSLASQASCTINVVYAPQTTLSADDLLTLKTSVGDYHSALHGAGAGVAAISLSTTELSFGNVLVGAVSPTQSVVVSNTGTDVLKISTISVPNGFTQSSNCASSLSPGMSCTVTVAFAPSALGAVTGELSIASNATTSPSLVALSGTGYGVPSISLSSSSLSFGNVAVGATSVGQTVIVTNSGSDALKVSTVTVSNGFTQFSNCIATLSPGASCTITVAFAPVATGVASGQLSITSNAASSPTVIALSGTGTGAPIVTLSNSTLSFGNVVVGTVSSAQSLVVTNTGNDVLKISAIGVSSGYVQSNNCGTSLAPNAACTISVSFAPTATGTLTGTLSIASNAASSPNLVTLSGTGTKKRGRK
jgi:hypothetical protein